MIGLGRALAFTLLLATLACRAPPLPEPARSVEPAPPTAAAASVPPASASASSSASPVPLASSAPSAAPAEHPIDGNAQNFFSDAEMAQIPSAERASWLAYLARSASRRERDRALLDAELQALGQRELVTAPYRKAFHVDASMSPEWLKSEAGRRFTDNLLTFQTPSGGWSKRVEFKDAPRRPGMSFYSENTSFHYIATIDNDSTTEELRYIALAAAAAPDARLGDAFRRGVDYLLGAQYPNGCFPQVYPLQGGYHDAATYNDNATVNVLRLLRDVAAGRFALASPEQRHLAAAALEQGLGCIVHSQVVEAGRRTVWAQQHHPLTLVPVAARRYELAGLCGRESAWISEFLMDLERPSPEVVAAVHASVDFYREHALPGLKYEGQVLTEAPGAPPLWARLYELETGRPIFSNRDGVRRYKWDELTDRRSGYTWYSDEPAKVLARYFAWAKLHPRKAH